MICSVIAIGLVLVGNVITCRNTSNIPWVAAKCSEDGVSIHGADDTMGKEVTWVQRMLILTPFAKLFVGFTPILKQ